MGARRLTLYVKRNEMKANRSKRRLLLAAGVGFASLLVSWLLLFQSSPFYTFFIWNVWFPDFWSIINLPAFLLGCIVSGNVHSPNAIATYVASFLQWFVVGYVLSLLIIRR